MLEALVGIGGEAPRGIWTKLADLSVARMETESAQLGGLLYTFGGNPNSSAHAADFKSYDPSTGGWTAGPTGPGARSLHGMCECDGKIWVYAGRNSGGSLGDLWAFDPVAGTWASKLATPTRYQHDMTSWDGKLYISSGYTTANQADLRCYDPALNTWTTLAPYGGIARARLTINAIDGKIYLIGGYTINATWCSDMWVYDIATNSWTQLPDIPMGGLGQHRTVVMEGKLYVHGGRTTAGPYLKQMWCYDPVANEWESLTSATLQRTELFMVPSPATREIYVGGGYVANAPSKEFWVFQVPAAEP